MPAGYFREFLRYHNNCVLLAEPRDGSFGDLEGSIRPWTTVRKTETWEELSSESESKSEGNILQELPGKQISRGNKDAEVVKNRRGGVGRQKCCDVTPASGVAGAGYGAGQIVRKPLLLFSRIHQVGNVAIDVRPTRKLRTLRHASDFSKGKYYN